MVRTARVSSMGVVGLDSRIARTTASDSVDDALAAGVEAVGVDGAGTAKGLSCATTQTESAMLIVAAKQIVAIPLPF